MRTVARDQGNTVVMTGYFDGINAASGSGFAQPDGIPFIWTRTGTGAYALKFDSRLMPTAIQASAGGAFNYATVGGPGAAGAVTFQTVDANNNGANSTVHFRIEARRV